MRKLYRRGDYWQATQLAATAETNKETERAVIQAAAEFNRPDSAMIWAGLAGVVLMTLIALATFFTQP